MYHCRRFMTYPLNETECTEPEESFRAMLAGQTLITELSDPFNATVCRQSCKTRTINAQRSNMQILMRNQNADGTFNIERAQSMNQLIQNQTLIAGSEPDWVFVTGFKRESMTVNKEKLLYEGVDIISAIGGGLGMFLGWSFYQMYIDISARLVKMHNGDK